MEILEIIGKLLIVNAFLCAIGNFIISFTLKRCITIKLPKRKKYLEKKTPIYKLIPNYWDDNCYSIQKWEHQYVVSDSFISILLYFIFPVTFHFKRWKYGYVSSYKIENSQIKDIISLEEEYEKLAKVDYEKEIETFKVKYNKIQEINKLNEEFNQNYVK